MKRKIFLAQLIMISFLFALENVSGQTATLAGFVRDKDGNPLAGASLLVNENRLGTVTDANGHYELKLAAGHYTVVASFIGHAEQTATVSIAGYSVTAQDFTTAEVYKSLEEVIVYSQRGEKINNGLKQAIIQPLQMQFLNIRRKY
jgi:iron complex outermembrane receptor protein